FPRLAAIVRSEFMAAVLENQMSSVSIGRTPGWRPPQTFARQVGGKAKTIRSYLCATPIHRRWRYQLERRAVWFGGSKRRCRSVVGLAPDFFVFRVENFLHRLSQALT